MKLFKLITLLSMGFVSPIFSMHQETKPAPIPPIYPEYESIEGEITSSEKAKELAKKLNSAYISAKAPRIKAALQDAIKEGAINVQFSNNNMTPLHLAALFGLDDMIKQLLGAGADVNALDINNATPIFYAIEHHGDIKDRYSTIQMLLAAHPNLNHRKDNPNMTIFEMIESRKESSVPAEVRAYEKIENILKTTKLG